MLLEACLCNPMLRGGLLFTDIKNVNSLNTLFYPNCWATITHNHKIQL